MCVSPGGFISSLPIGSEWNRLLALHPRFDNAAFAVCIFISSRTDSGTADLMMSAKPDMTLVEEVRGLNNYML